MNDGKRPATKIGFLLGHRSNRAHEGKPCSDPGVDLPIHVTEWNADSAGLSDSLSLRGQALREDIGLRPQNPPATVVSV
ncbi:3-hydroxylacyl-ACP dehydratase [Anopheles sinensis]|uniref:3-hydroxylacyl-ACP dehydratase n=1 Tax=Anopheles sinensis TaxID=74873 RepID=A0A084WRR0_ANOSI|nr:3-hydroxylacyl-ACP dehydratase [Anopheles sinensis]